MDEIERTSCHPTTREIHRCFSQATRELGGQTMDGFDHGEALWVRCVLPLSREVRRSDGVQGGVALRATASAVMVHPFLLRQVCTNGAVRTHAFETRVIPRLQLVPAVAASHAYDVTATLDECVAAIQRCASPAAFEDGVDEMRASLDIEAELVIDRLGLHALLSSLGRTGVPEMVGRVLARQLRLAALAGGRERTAFAFGNALTAAGRDAPNPRVRWALEEYGAAVFGASVLDQAPPAATVRGQAVRSAAGDGG
jgi:hypothetical protein